VLLWNFRNVALKVDENNQNCKPVKRNSKDKIDGVIALIQALAGYQLSEQHTINII
jgi:phage terminase large subunit-like protein